jgi:hypothetical protein
MRTGASLSRERIVYFVSIFLFGALVFYFFFLSLNHLGDPDLWFHLRTGQMTFETGQLPGEVDPFSYTTPNPIPEVQLRGIRTQWLGQTVFFLLFEMLGARGFAFLRSLLAIVPFVIFFLVALRRGASPAGLLFVTGLPMFIMAHASYDTFERPQAFSFLLAPVAYAIAMRLRGSFSIPLAAALAGIMALWSNLHGGYIIGLALISCVAAGGALSLAAQRFSLPGHGYLGDPPEKPLAFFAALFAAFMATGINPAGWIVHQWAIGLVKGIVFSAGSKLGSGQVMSGIQEYKPVWSFLASPSHGYLYALIAFYALSVLSLCLKYWGRLRIDLSEAFSICVIVFFGMAYMRGVTFALIFSGMLASMALFHIRGRGLMAVAVSSALAMALLAGSLAMNRPWMLSPRPPARWISSTYPESSLRFLDSSGARGRMFNLMEWGGYIAWRSYPERQVFFDGREISSGVMSKYFQVVEARPGWRNVLDGYEVDVMLIPLLYGDNGIVAPPVFRMALEGPGPWRLVNMDHNQVVLVREGAAGVKGALECCRMPFERIYGQIVDVAALKLLQQPGHPDIMLSQAFGLFWSGRYSEALGTLDSMPENPVSLHLRREVARAMNSN